MLRYRLTQQTAGRLTRASMVARRLYQFQSIHSACRATMLGVQRLWSMLVAHRVFRLVHRDAGVLTPGVDDVKV